MEAVRVDPFLKAGRGRGLQVRRVIPLWLFHSMTRDIEALNGSIGEGQ